MFLCLGRPKNIEDIGKKVAVDNIIQNNLPEMRKKIKILVLDDDEFTSQAMLERHGYSINSKLEIPHIDAVKDFSIILCDLKGVGSNFSGEGEGAHLIREIKKAYPEKSVIAYSGGHPNERIISEARKYSDNFLRKGADTKEWVEVLDTELKKVINPIFFWKKVRILLLEAKVSPIDLAKLEDVFVCSIEKENLKLLEKSKERFENVGNLISGVIRLMEIWMTFAK